MNVPVYDRHGVQVHHGDCLDVLAQLADDSIAAVVCDPPYSLSFMGRDWDHHDTTAGFQTWCQQWATECLRVLKPGGHLVAFGGARTYHRLTCGIEDAGFDIRDSVAWLYGNGKPHGQDVGKAIDKAGGGSPVDQGQVLKAARERAGMSRQDVAAALGCKPQSLGDWEDGRSRAVGAPREVCIPSARYRTELVELFGYADEALREVLGVHRRTGKEAGTYGAFVGDSDITAPATLAAARWDGWNTSLRPSYEPIIVARKPLAGTVAANVLAHGTGAYNISATKIEGERWPANVVLDECVAADLGERARYFYCPKAPASERPKVDGVVHVSVKPLALMKWLVRLVTPPGGLVLDPFAGSGTTLQAARDEGFHVIGIEREATYLPLIRARLDARPRQATTAPVADDKPMDLLDLLEGGAA